MKESTKKWLIIGAVAFVLVLIYTSSYNKVVTLEEGINAQWGNVETAYQRRLDLIPNLVNTVKGYADFEKETLTQVIEARSKATSVNIDPTKLNASAMAQFQQSQGTLSSALSRLMVVVEKYPDLKANQNFLQLQAQLEGTENRISVERRKYNEAARVYNSYIKKFPRNIFFSSKERKAYFEAEEAAAIAPKVQF